VTWLIYNDHFEESNEVRVEREDFILDRKDCTDDNTDEDNAYCLNRRDIAGIKFTGYKVGNGVKLQQAMIVLENEDLDFTIGSDLNENPKTLEGKLYVMVGEDDKAGNYTCVMYDDVDDLPTKGFLNDDNADKTIEFTADTNETVELDIEFRSDETVIFRCLQSNDDD